MEFTFDLLEDTYDIIVCGAGPAGLIAVETLQREAKMPMKIALLDKRDPWREPVACAEAVHKGGLHRLTAVQSKWIRSTIDGVWLVSPDGTRIKYTSEGSGLILDRALMHYDLACRAQKNGAHCHYKTRIKSIGPLIEKYRSIDVEIEGKVRTIRARGVIDASGAGPSLTKESLQNGILEHHFDVEPAVFGLVSGIPCETNYIEMYFGHHYAPGGYAWVFPRDDKVTNVGIVVGREFLKTHPPRKMYQKFIESFGEGVVSGALHGGPIACGQPRELIAADYLFKSGDAADMVNPISRAGILEAMYAGKHAALGLIEVFNSPSTNHAKIYKHYQKLWFKHKGNGHDKLAKAKKAFSHLKDEHLDKAAHQLANIPDQKRTMWRILWSTLTSQPRLIWQMRSLL